MLAFCAPPGHANILFKLVEFRYTLLSFGHPSSNQKVSGSPFCKAKRCPPTLGKGSSERARELAGAGKEGDLVGDGQMKKRREPTAPRSVDGTEP